MMFPSTSIETVLFPKGKLYPVIM